MKFVHCEAFTEIVLEGEDRGVVIACLAEASFELAPHDKHHLSDWSSDDRLPRSDLTRCLCATPSSLRPVLSMGVVRGRHCDTIVHQVGENILTLYRPAFNRFRHPETLPVVLQRTNDRYLCTLVLLARRDELFDALLLEHRLACYGVERATGESDWAFRRRAFVELSPHWPAGAYEFLLGAFQHEFSRSEQDSLVALATTGWLVGHDQAALRSLLVEFSRGFSEDPLPKRQRVRQAARN